MFRLIQITALTLLIAWPSFGAAQQTGPEAPEAESVEVAMADAQLEEAQEAGEQVIDFEFEEKAEPEEDMFDQPVFNEFVTLDFKNADIQNVIRLISARTGLNILLDPAEVVGEVTLHLDNVRLGHALDNILKTNKLAYIVETGDILRIVPEARVGIQEVETHTEVIQLSWRNALDIEQTFQPFLSPYGSMKSNAEAQALIITDVPPTIEKIKDLIEQIDKPDRQVVIEARLVDIQIGAAKELRLQWSATKLNKNAGANLTSPVFESFFDPDTGEENQKIFQRIATGTDALGAAGTIGGVLPILVEGLGINGGRGTFQFGSKIGIFGDDYDINATLTALERLNVVEVLANPRVSTLNNIPASIQIIERIPYAEAVTGPGGNTVTEEIEFEEAGVRIDVTPIITPNSFVRMDMQLTQTIFRGRVGGGALSPPAIDERRADTTVIVENQNTVVLGGLRSIRRINSVEGVPWLHRIPAIGWLFKDKNEDQAKTELVLMVTPTVIEEPVMTDREKQLYDSIDVKWHLPDYYFDDVKNEDDKP